MNIPRTIAITKRQLAFVSISASLALAGFVSAGAAVAFAFCAYVILTA